MIETIFHENKIFEDIVWAAQDVMQREFENCTFKNCNLTNCNFAKTIFSECTFIGCNLASIKLKGASLKDVTFKQCKLIGINFAESENFLFSVGFDGCALDYAIFSRRKMQKTKFVRCSLKDADFSGADLSQVIFDNCDLSRAVFDRTELIKTDFTSSYNYTLDPDVNSVKGAKFSLDGLPGLLAKYDIVVNT